MKSSSTAARLTGGTLVFVALLAGCSPSPTGDNGPIIDPGTQVTTCTASEQCPKGHICAAGTCLIGECDPVLESACDVEGLDSPYCCKVWELCSQGPLSTVCASDPNSRGIGCSADDQNCTPCEVQDDCAAGQFCSGAACFDAAGRTSCTSSFQCPGGERCDRTVFLCVPDRGGCTFCGPEFPELCCEDGQVCSEQTGFCQEVPGAECDENTPCSPGLQCDPLSRCVQCITDEDCGPGLACDEGAGNCFSLASVCESDDDCNGNKRCALASQECVIPQCESDSDCTDEFDERWSCDTAQFSCFLPPAVCEDETDEGEEDNDVIERATPIQDSSHAGTLCRGDSDYLSFPVNPAKRYTVEVRFPGSGQAGITAVLLDTAGLVESSAVFTQTQAFVQLAGVTGDEETGLFALKVTGNNIDADRWTYAVTVTESEPSAPAECPEGAPNEPNDSFNTATPLTASVEGVTQTFSRCGTNDVDFYRIAVSRQHGVEVLIGGFYNAEGNINAELFKAPNTNVGSRVDQATGVNDVESLDAPEGPAEFWLKVQLGSTSGAVSDQRYTLTVREVPRPEACAADTNEPGNDDLATATEVQLTGDADMGIDPAGSAATLRCNAQDVDHFAFTVPPSRSAVVRLRFNHSEGNMKLDVLDPTGAVIPNGTSDVSTAMSDPDEQVTVPGTPDGSVTYIARVQLSGTASATIAQPYTIEVATYDDALCLASEPEGGNNTFATGICLGDVALYESSILPCANFGPEPLLPECVAAPAGTPGCGLVCGNADSDYFRVGKLKNDQTMHAVLTYTPSLGAIDLVRSSVTTPSGSPTETTVSDTDGDGRIELWFVETSENGKEHAVRVKPKGNVGHEQQPYTLTVEVGPECDDDVNDLNQAANDKPATATAIEEGIVLGVPLEIAASRCNSDVDVYAIALYPGERIAFSLEQEDPVPAGLQAELGLGTNDLNRMPMPVVVAAAGAEAVTFDNDARRVVYLTVRPVQDRMPPVLLTGPYTLTVTVTAPTP